MSRAAQRSRVVHAEARPAVAVVDAPKDEEHGDRMPRLDRHHPAARVRAAMADGSRDERVAFRLTAAQVVARKPYEDEVPGSAVVEDLHNEDPGPRGGAPDHQDLVVVRRAALC